MMFAGFICNVLCFNAVHDRDGAQAVSSQLEYTFTISNASIFAKTFIGSQTHFGRVPLVELFGSHHTSLQRKHTFRARKSCTNIPRDTIRSLAFLFQTEREHYAREPSSHPSRIRIETILSSSLQLPGIPSLDKDLTPCLLYSKCLSATRIRLRSSSTPIISTSEGRKLKFVVARTDSR
jgi:hypothetical protein